VKVLQQMDIANRNELSNKQSQVTERIAGQDREVQRWAFAVQKDAVAMQRKNKMREVVLEVLASRLYVAVCRRSQAW
jgi:hypothetical protein